MIRSQIDAVRREMEGRPAGLVQHVVRVVREARSLARAWDVDGDRAELAAWGHDLFRAYAPEEQLRLAVEAGIAVATSDREHPVLLHGPLAAVVLRERFAVADDEALAAVRDHTLGGAGMPMLAKVLLVADKVEAGKRAAEPELAAIRLLAHRDIDAALLCWSDWKWYRERLSRWDSDPRHWEARAEWVAEHHRDVALPARLPLAEEAGAGATLRG